MRKIKELLNEALFNSTSEFSKADNIDNPDFVDLGLSVNWAKCNVGAKNETDRGKYLNFEQSKKCNCPTKEDIQELIDNTSVKRVRCGFKVISNKYPDKYIIFPYSGLKNKYGTIQFDDFISMIWSETSINNNESNVLTISGRINGKMTINNNSNNIKIPVREVL